MTSAAPVHYHLTPVDPAAHRAAVRMEVSTPDPAGQILRCPAWIPGSYTIREFARHLIDVRAFGPDGDVPLTRIDKDTWQAAPCAGPLTVTYTVYAWELTVRTSHLDRQHGFFNGTNVFLAAEGLTHRPHDVTLHQGEDPAVADWRVATTLPRTHGDAWGFGSFRAADHDELLDHPIEMGTFELVSFDVASVPHHLAITGVHHGDTARLVRDVQAACAQHVALFGGTPPVSEYLFQLTVVGDGYGGLEHRASTALIARRDDLPYPGMTTPSDGYLNLLGLFSHEYFHTWNVKRIKPAAFVPYDLSKPVHTTLMWAFEGITSYYDDLGLLRSGTIDRATWLTLVGRTITRVRRAPGLAIQSLADSSFDAWTKLYKPDENTANVQISYYSKGSLLALALDLQLRRAGVPTGLDAVMQALWAQVGDGRGVAEDGVEALVAELAGPAVAQWLHDAVWTPGEVPLADVLSDVGVTLHARVASGPSDRGGTAGTAGEEGLGTSLGATWKGASGGVSLRTVAPDGAAHRAGLSAGDLLVAVDRLRVDPKGLERRLARARPGSRWTVHAFRRDELFETLVEPDPAPQDTWYLTVDDDASAEQIAARDAWLGTPPTA